MPADSQVRLVRMLAASGTMRFDPSDMLAVIDGRLDRHGIDYGYIAELLALRGVHVLPEQAYHTPLTDLEAALAAPRAEEPITFDDAADLIEKARDWRYSAEWLGKRDRAAPRAEGPLRAALKSYDKQGITGPELADSLRDWLTEPPPHEPPHDARDCPECDYWLARAEWLREALEHVLDVWPAPSPEEFARLHRVLTGHDSCSPHNREAD